MASMGNPLADTIRPKFCSLHSQGSRMHGGSGGSTGAGSAFQENHSRISSTSEVFGLSFCNCPSSLACDPYSIRKRNLLKVSLKVKVFKMIHFMESGTQAI